MTFTPRDSAVSGFFSMRSMIRLAKTLALTLISTTTFLLGYVDLLYDPILRCRAEGIKGFLRKLWGAITAPSEK